MLFNSYIFIFIFLPLTLIGWYFLMSRSRSVLALSFLTVMSLWFYGFFNPSYLLIILSSILINYLLSFLFDKFNKRFAHKILLWIGLIFNLGLLFVFKYYDFFVTNINSVFKCDFATKNILLPLGISFFTFQQLSFIIDRYKGEALHYRFINYATFVTFFPQLVAGPIVLYDEMMDQFDVLIGKKINASKFMSGIELFIIGLSKKVLLADVLALAVNHGFDNYLYLDSPTTFLVSIFYALELYFDFSGYSDMAIGLGRMFGIDLPTNFKSPYKSYSVKNLWQNWHITLTRFFTRYVYIPLGGSKKGEARKLLNVFIVFLLSGIWHGANWTFIIWGIIQGLLVDFDNLRIIGVLNDKEKKPLIVIPKIAGQIITFLLFAFSLVIFRSDNMNVAITMLKNLFSFKVTGYFPKILPCFDIPEIYVIKEIITLKAPNLINVLYIVTMTIIVAISTIVVCSKNAIQIVDEQKESKLKSFFFIILFAWSVISFSQVSTFIYFNF